MNKPTRTQLCYSDIEHHFLPWFSALDILKILEQWIADECLVGSNDLEDTPDNLWNSWSLWAKSKGLLYVVSNPSWLGRRLEKSYPAFRDGKGKRKHKGIRLRGVDSKTHPLAKLWN